MPTLDSDAKKLIIRELATFKKPSEVQNRLKEEYGVNAGLDQIMYYDPNTRNGARLTEKWKGLFFSIREKYLKEVDDIPIANVGYRMQQLQGIFDKMLEAGEYKDAVAVLKEAKEETKALQEKNKNGTILNQTNIQINGMGSTTISELLRGKGAEIDD